MSKINITEDTTLVVIPNGVEVLLPNIEQMDPGFVVKLVLMPSTQKVIVKPYSGQEIDNRLGVQSYYKGTTASDRNFGI